VQVRTIALAVLPFLAAGIACSNGFSSFDATPSTSGGAFGGATPPSASSAVADGPCPADPYSTDARCVAPLRCEYGTSPSSACNTIAECNNQGVFDITPASSTACDDRCPTFDAPGALTTAQGTPCVHGSRGALVCGSPYDRSTCGCVDPSTTDGGAPPPLADAAGAATDASMDPDATADAADAMPPDVPGVWLCVTPAAGCPATRPPVGGPCVRELTCDYGACLFPGGMKVTCTGTGTGGAAKWVDQTPIECGGKT
jgi:hypothetical protein